MSKNPIFDATLWDHNHSELRGTSLLFAAPPLPLYTTKNWVPAKKVEGWGESKAPEPQKDPEWKTFLRCLTWWAG